MYNNIFNESCDSFNDNNTIVPMFAGKIGNVLKS